MKINKEELKIEAEKIIDCMDAEAHSKLYDACVKSLSNVGYDVIKTLPNKYLARMVVGAMVDVNLLGDAEFTNKVYRYYEENFPY